MGGPGAEPDGKGLGLVVIQTHGVVCLRRFQVEVGMHRELWVAVRTSLLLGVNGVLLWAYTVVKGRYCSGKDL